MIVVTGAGQLRKEFPAAFTGSFTYPVGDLTSVAEYSPVTLVFNSGTFASGNYVGVNLVDAVYPDPNITLDYITRYWTISQSNVTSFNCNATYQYLAADVNGAENKLSCTRVNPTPWIAYGLTNTGTHVLSATGIQAFGSYTGVHGGTNPPVNLELQNITLGSGQITCYDATGVLTVAGNGNTFVVQNGASVTLIAGNMVSVLPGATVQSGGYLHAFIATTSDYCGSYGLNPTVANIIPEDMPLNIDPLNKNKFIKIYPNPTSDFVIVEINQVDASSVIQVDIYSMIGEKIIHKIYQGEAKQQFSFANQPVGVYLIQVKADDRSEIAKVIKN
jgi:hypothetical protein